MSTGLRFTLEVDGLPPDAFAVVSFHLNQSLSSLFSLVVSLVSQQFVSLEFQQMLAKMAFLRLWQGDDVQRRVKGMVTWFELGENDKNQMLYSMKVCPPLWRTGLRQNFRIFQNEDIESILGTILQENGVTEWSPLFSEPHPSREFCVQYGETDYDFLCRMAAEEGIFFYEEHAQKSTDQSLVLCDTVRYLPESFEIPWNPNTRTEVSTLCISQFRYSAQIRPSSVVTKDYTFKRPGWAGRFDQEGQYQDYQRTQYEVYDYPGRFKGAHGQNFARWQMDGWRNNAETARGMSRSPEIWPGRRIVLTGHPQANLNREWQVVASELHGEQPQAVPGRQGAGTALENHFAVIPADRTWRPQPLLKPLVDGPQSAVVTGPAGEEIFCDEHGRVRVKFNWDRYNPADQDSSCWIRVAQAWAGTGFGHLAIQRVGQEVIVDFLNGDPDQPIIMGRTYHQENRTPGSLPGTKTQMTIRSKTYKGSGFNELKFDDATGKEQVYIHAQKNMNTEVLNNRTTDVINNHAETIGNNQMIAVTNNQIQTVGVNQIETVGSNRNRYYDPLQGRYITQDPIGLAGGWNLYNYPLNPIIRMDPLGLYNLYQLLYDVWHDDSYGTSSIDITGSGDLISLGGHAGLGVAFAKKKGEMLSDICIYATACGHAGIGGGINAAITYSETKSLPTSGVSNSVGVTVGGGVGGHFAYTYVVDVDNPESSTESVGIGAGVDASVMTLACRTWQECWVN